MGSKIKKIISLIVLCCAISPLYAQQFDWDDPRINWEWNNNRHSFTINAGYNSIIGILTKEIFMAAYSATHNDTNGDAIQIISNTPYGDYGFQYHYNTHKWLRFGLKFNADINRTNINDKTQYISYLNLMASAQFTYYNERKWRVYSGLDLGVNGLIVPQFNSFSAGLAFNVTALGVTYGRGFILLAELNLGSDAIAKAGFGLRL